MRVTVMSRERAVRYSYGKHEQKAVAVSIGTPGEVYIKEIRPTVDNGIVAVVRLYFEDAETGDGCITVGDAERIKALLQRFPEHDVIIHCDVGVSRSAGVAAAVLKHCTGDDTQIFDNPVYRPNMRCYRTVLNVLEGVV